MIKFIQKTFREPHNVKHVLPLDVSVAQVHYIQVKFLFYSDQIKYWKERNNKMAANNQ
jgi:hypothetical protein